MHHVIGSIEQPQARGLAARADFAGAEGILQGELERGDDKVRSSHDLSRVYEAWGSELFDSRDFTGALEKLKKFLGCGSFDPDKEFRARQLLLHLYRRLDMKQAAWECLRDLEERYGRCGDPYLENQTLNEREITEHQAVLKSWPNRLTVRLTNQCNILCVTCVMPTYKPWYVPEKTFEEIMTMTPYLSDLQWQGGEPMVFNRIKFKSLIERAARNPHLSQNMITNGILIDREWAETFVRCRVHTRISIDGTTKEVYEKIRRGAKWEDLLRGIDLINEQRDLQKNNVRLELHMVVMKSNHHQLAEMVEFAHKHRFDIVDFSHIIIGANDPSEDVFIRHATRESWRTIQEGRKQAAELARRYNIRFGDTLPFPPPDMIDEEPKRARSDDGGLDAAVRAFQAGGSVAKAESASAVAVLDRPTILDDEQQRKPVHHDIDPLFCLSPWKQIIIREDGGLITNWHCINDGRHMHIGRVERDGLMRAWNSKFMQLLRRRISTRTQKGLCTEYCLSGALIDSWRDQAEWL